MILVIFKKVQKEEIPSEWRKQLPASVVTYTIKIVPEGDKKDENLWKDFGVTHMFDQYSDQDSIYDSL